MTSKINDERQKQIIELYLAGNSIKSISSQLNCDKSVISKILKINNIDINYHNETKLSSENIQELIDIYNKNGATIHDIMKKFKITHKRAVKILKENNVKRKKANPFGAF